MKKKVISMFLTACTVSVMVVGGGSNLVMADDAETVTLIGWYDEDDMNPILGKVNEQMDGKYVIEYTYVANTDYNNVLSTACIWRRPRHYYGWNKLSSRNQSW